MLLAKLPISKRGRVTLPRQFMLANDISPGDTLEMRLKYNSDDEIIVRFVRKENNK